MKILSVLTLVSPDAAYGGPLRVALNQAEALRGRGHEVTLVAGQRGFGRAVPTSLGGAEARLFKVHQVPGSGGFAGLWAPGMLSYLARHARSYDVVHLHLARDLVTLPAAGVVLASGVPYVVQSHGMIDASSHPLAGVLDTLATVPVLSRSAATFYLTATEQRNLRLVAPRATLHQLGNGVPTSQLRADTSTAEVLFLARVAERKRPEVMVDAAEALAAEFPGCRFRLVGPDEGVMRHLGPRMERSSADVAWEGPLSPEQTLERMSRAGVYLLPSVDEPWGMSVLEAMSVGLPVVITDSNGLAETVRRRESGIVTETDPASVVEGVRTVLRDRALAERLAGNGLRAVEDELGMEAIAVTLEEVYRASALKGVGRGRRARRRG